MTKLRTIDVTQSITVDDLPTLGAAGIDGSVWTSEGAPVFARDHDTADLWPILNNSNVGVSIVIGPRGRLFRLG